jgi:hypothetical protein
MLSYRTNSNLFNRKRRRIMIARTKIGRFRATWVLRHRWEKGAKDGVLSSNYEAHKLRTTLRLGIWTKRNKVVGSVKRDKDKKAIINKTFANDNLVNNYMIGMDLIICKVWVDFTFNATFGRK